MKSMADFEKETAKKRARLECDLALAQALPTNGARVAYMRPGPWNADGMARGPAALAFVAVAPWIIHGPTAYGYAEHVAYRAPDSYDTALDRYGADYKALECAYIRAVVNAYRPALADWVAVKGNYSGYFPAGFDWQSVRDYATAAELARGAATLRVSIGLGEHSFSSARLELVANVAGRGRVVVSFDAPRAGACMPRPGGVHHYANGPVSSVDSWQKPPAPAGAVNYFQYGGGDSGRRSASAAWLFDTVDNALAAAGY